MTHQSAVNILAMMFAVGTVALCGNAVAQGASFQVVEGKHLILKSDSATRESLVDYVEAFDAAVPQWERFWGMDAGTLNQWQIDGFVISDPDRFRDSGDLPPALRFPFGYAMPGNIWVMRQKSDYYTRHLLLHEGVHALAIDHFDGTGPSWFSEGLAEMLGVHQGAAGDVQVNVVPASRNAVPYWGRFKLLSAKRRENRIPTLDSILRYPLDLKSDVETYGWCWSAMMLFSEYPEYRPSVLKAAENGSDRTRVFAESFKRPLQSQWPIVQARWRMLTATMDYGFDWSRERIDLSMNDPLWDGKAINQMVKADQGWQSLGVRFSPGMRIKLNATGQCTIDDLPKPWKSEPAGVTIHYANDRPLGQLLVCVLPNKTDEQEYLNPLEVKAVTGASEIVIDKHCWLLFRINDYLGDLGNNQGGYSVTVERDRR